jgi:hypothetical protein
MMFEFEAEVQNGQIIIPDEYRSDVANGTIVKITLPAQPKVNFFDQPFIQELRQNPPELRTKGGILGELMENPVSATGWREMTREEMHER